MPHLSNGDERVPARCASVLFILSLLLFGSSLSLEAQRHPESAGPNPYYRDEPGVSKDPEWLQRPAFIRGPMDRYERGRTRLFLNTMDNVPYLNYANDNYILWQRQTQSWFALGGRPDRFRNVRWDRVGNYMGGGYQRVFSFEEARSGTDNSGFSMIDHRNLLLRMGHYTYKDLHWTVTAGDNVRTKFTPLTLVQSHLASARLDVDYKGSERATLLYNRGREDLGLFSTWGARTGDDYQRGGEFQDAPVLMYGMHWEHREGEYLSVGTTLLNQLMAFPSSPKSSALRGDLPYEMIGPKIIRVFIADDLPDDSRTRARAYDVDVVLTGTRGSGDEQEGEAVRLSSTPGDSDFDARLTPTVVGGEILAGGGREVSGREVVVYEFAIPADITVTSARFGAEVEGDYRIGVRQTHDFATINNRGDVALVETQWPATPIGTEGRRPFKWYIDEDVEEPYFTVARSDGKGSNGSNRKVVYFDYGMPTGQSFASVDWEADLVGLKVSGEVAFNVQNFMYPVGDNRGDRSSEKTWAYWVNGIKDLAGDRIELGGEIFSLDPNYSGGYDSQRGGLPFHIDTQKGTRVNSVTQEFDLIEDNDDDDQWPDEFAQEIAAIGHEYPGWPNAQVFPGLDENSDSMADIDRNENFILDWEEAFLTYDSDPREFVYGIDFNNNDMPDFRENDDLPDYPYRRDQKGRHLFLRFNRLGRLGDYVTIGQYRSEEMAGGGESKSLYLRYAYHADRPDVGGLRINYDVKKVEDDIADHSFVFIVPPDDAEVIPWLNRPDNFPEVPGKYRPATPDLLLMRDSWVHTFFLDSEYVKFRNVNIENSLLWQRNSQAEIEGENGDELIQPEDVRSRFGLSNKIDYTWNWGALTVQPKFKHRFLYENVDSEEEARTSYSDFIPIVQAFYELTVNTQLMAGAQGLPGLPYKHWDRSDENSTFTQTDYLGMVRINSDYFGRALSYFLGYHRTKKDYSRLKERNVKHGMLFMDLMVPF